MTPGDERDVEALLDTALAGRYQARLGELVDVLGLPGVVARDGSRIVGTAMYRVDGGAAELAVIVVVDDQRRAGIGTALVEGGRGGVCCGGCPPVVAGHDERQRRRTALLSASRLSPR